VVDFANQFVRLEAENVQIRKAAKSSADQVQEANRLAAEAQNENASLKEAEEEDEGGAGIEAQGFHRSRQETGHSSQIHRKLVK
jgi:hypothetical protein